MFNTGLKWYETADIDNFTSSTGIRLRKAINGPWKGAEDMEYKEAQMTGYPSIDKPWLKYYSKEAIEAPLPEGSLYDYMISCNRDHMDDTALTYFGKKMTYRQLDARIGECAKALTAYGVRKGEIVSLCMLTMPETLILLYAVNRIGAVCNFLVLNATEQEMRGQVELAESRIVFAVSIAAEKVVQKRGYLPVAYVVLRNADTDQEEARRSILNLCRAELNSSSQLHGLHFVDRLPLTRAGKIDFRELERMAKEDG